MNTVLFIQEDIFQKLGSMYISRVFREYGWEATLLISSLENDLKEEIQRINPDVLALNCTSGEYDAWGRSIARLAKESLNNVIVMLGGPHATYFSDVIQDESIDYVCIGEGERPVSTFCERWNSKGSIEEIDGFWIKKNGEIIKNRPSRLIDDIDTIPFPDRTLYDRYPFINRLSNVPVITTRGCPFKCSFCYNDSFLKMFKGLGKTVRRRSVENVIEEIQELRIALPSMKTICFYDDLFCCDIPKGWLHEFCIRYKEQVGLPFATTAFASWLTEDIVPLMKEANCIGIKFGIESGSERVRTKILKKPVKNDEICHAARLLHKHKIRFVTYNMLGIPTENYQDSLNTYEMNRKIRPYYAWCSLLNPYRGTTIADIAEKEGCLPQSFEFTNLFFSETPLLIDRKDDTKRLQKFFAFGVAVNIPAPAAAFIVRKFRITFVYDLLFAFFYSFRITRLTGYTLKDMIIMGLKTKVLKFCGLGKKGRYRDPGSKAMKVSAHPKVTETFEEEEATDRKAEEPEFASV